MWEWQRTAPRQSDCQKNLDNSFNSTIFLEEENGMTVKQTAGRTALGEFAPKFAELNDDVLIGQVCSWLAFSM